MKLSRFALACAAREADAYCGFPCPAYNTAPWLTKCRGARGQLRGSRKDGALLECGGGNLSGAACCARSPAWRERGGAPDLLARPANEMPSLRDRTDLPAMVDVHRASPVPAMRARV